MVCADIPLTPPSSPGPEQSIVAITPQEVCPGINHQFIHPDDAPQVSSEPMEVDRETIDEEQEAMPPPRPRRLLEDETVHLTRTGIELSDFEVRGTLGSLFCHFLSFESSNRSLQVPGPLARFS
jgi:hypothetical protein